jgi:hypothetical protein
MNAKTVRITKDLYWVALRYRFYTVDMLKTAIEDGTFDAMLQKCADEMYNGEFKLAIAAMRKNLSSQQTNMNKAEVVAPEAKDDWKRFNLLWDYTTKLLEAIKPTVANLPEATKAKARWQLTKEEIDLIPKDDYNTLDSIYQNMMSKKSKKPEIIEETIGMKVFLDRLDYVSKLRSSAESTKKVATQQLEVSATIMGKLNKGGKTTLSEKEVQELLALFSKVQK